MPTELAGAHLRQAQANFDLAIELESSNPAARQWSCTLFFYAALHCVQAMTESERAPQTPQLRRGSHAWDEMWVGLNARHLHRTYRDLRRASRRARYDLFYPTAADVAECRAAATAIVQYTARGLEP